GEQSRLNKEEFSDLCVRHLRHWLQRSFSLGRGPDLWKRWVLGETEVFQNRPGLGKDPERNGFLALDEQADHPNFKNRRREFLSNPNDFQVAKQSLRNAGFQGKVSQELKTQVLEIQERAAHLGVRIVWVLHPGLERDFEFHQLAAEEPSIHLLAFDDPDRYPKLYQKRHHWDMHHLNAQGASIWTEQLAQDWLALAQSLDS
ncbi:MAG: hypothetical protein MK213_06275, partial [Planctomycetes bacterium]|nr:hypothetical protein [Planctomycetota bacterium]